METTAADGKKYKVDYYSLDMILSVGYRVNSINATRFRQWANNVLKQYLLRGFSINQHLVAMQQQIDTRFNKLEQTVEQHQQQRTLLLLDKRQTEVTCTVHTRYNEKTKLDFEKHHS